LAATQPPLSRSKMPAAHAHCHTAAESLAKAQALCVASGARFTPMRQAVYEYLLAQKAPASAYDLLGGLQQRLGKMLAPPTVYRALEFLLQQGLIHRLETTNAYLICDHPEEAHESVYLVCGRCGETQEVDDPAIGKLLMDCASARGFTATKPVIEVSGICAKCR